MLELEIIRQLMQTEQILVIVVVVVVVVVVLLSVGSVVEVQAQQYNL
jgi:hypothetical protein